LARVCAVCGKGVVFGHRVSHSNKKSLRRWEPNLHRVRVMVQGEPRRLRVCSRCLKSGKVARAL
jgi:large subunit ribosomal protein L28